MATKRKSIIEEALLEAKSLEDALKANTKEMLAAHMKQEIENIVESSLTEEDEEIEAIDVEGSDEKMEEMPALDAGEDSEGDAEKVDSEESELMDLDIDLDGLAADDEEVEIDVELPAALDMGDEEELDLTGASDEEVIAVFKKMSDDDEVEVVKDEDGIHLTDNETGAEYYIKESDEMGEGYDVHEGEDYMEEGEDYMKEGEDYMKEAGCGKGLDEAGCGDHMEEETIYEIELDEKFDHVVLGGNKDDKSKTHSGEDYVNEKYDDVVWGGDKDDDSKTHPGKKDYMEEGDDMYEETLDLDEEDEISEDKLKRHQSTGYQRYSGAKAGSDQASPYGGVSESRKRRTPKNVERVSESKIMKEYKELKSKNEEYKGALKVFKNKLNEVALFNTNLAYVNRLFTEHSTTKNEKMEILKRFDSAESIKESKSIYKSVKSELESKTPITESVENKVNKTVKSSKSDLNESTAYVDPQITAIKDLMRKIS